MNRRLTPQRSSVSRLRWLQANRHPIVFWTGSPEAHRGADLKGPHNRENATASTHRKRLTMDTGAHLARRTRLEGTAPRSGGRFYLGSSSPTRTAAISMHRKRLTIDTAGPGFLVSCSSALRVLRFREERADVVQMSEKTFRIRVGFATENFIAVDGELIEKILLLARPPSLARRSTWLFAKAAHRSTSFLARRSPAIAGQRRLATNPGKASVNISSWVVDLHPYFEVHPGQ